MDAARESRGDAARRTRAGAAIGCLVVGACTHAAAGQERLVQLLPDLQPLTSYMSGWTIQTSGSQRFLRFSTGDGNGGQGAFEVRSTATIITRPDGSQAQLINQRVYNSDGTFSDVPAGYHLYHPTHGHFHIEGWNAYRLREFLPGGAVGPVVAQSKYTSFCLLDTSHYNPALPGSPATSVYSSCGPTVQGISVGWNDALGSSLDGQAIEVTCLPNGTYFLEHEADPDHLFVETNETNNSGRIVINITPLPAGGFYFAAHPQSRTVCPGAAAVFSATVTGAPTGYQWKRGAADLVNGGNISGATSPTLTINPVAPADAGTYTLVVSGACVKTSDPATLTVCYANCDCSTAPPALNVADFTCFLQKYLAGNAYANCDGSTAPPAVNVGDFTCFLQKYNAGCP